jgi:hypothetical protein
MSWLTNETSRAKTLGSQMQIKSLQGRSAWGRSFVSAQQVGAGGINMIIEFTDFSRPHRLASLTRLRAMNISYSLTFESRRRTGHECAGLETCGLGSACALAAHADLDRPAPRECDLDEPEDLFGVMDGLAHHRRDAMIKCNSPCSRWITSSASGP